MRRANHRAVEAALLGAALLVAPACRRASPPRPSIVLVSIDTLRSDRLPAYGYPAGATPAIDALVADGLLFARAFAEAPLTLPSHASLLTGLRPPDHGVRDNLGFAVDPARGELLQQRLKQLGYATGAAVSAQVLAARTGIAAGFDFYDGPGDDPARDSRTPVAERPGDAALAAASRFLDGVGDRPFLLFVHLYEPHTPYRPPEPFRSRFADPYDGEIAAADALVGRLLDELRRRGLYDGALVVLLSDHGEGLGDHGEDEHGLLLYREALQVPLVVKLPGGERSGERVERNVALIDLVPTLLERLEVVPQPALPGISLLDRGVPAERPLYAETMYPLIHFGWSDLASVVAGDLHLVEGPAPELFDLARDPAERHNRLGEDRRRLAAMRQFLGRIDRTLAPPRAADAATVAALGALGYLGQSALPADRAHLANPREQVLALAPVLRGMRLVREGDYAAAVTTLEGAARDGVTTPHLWQFLGAAYDALGEKGKAVEAYRQGMRLAGSPAYLAETAALRLLELGRPQASLDLVTGELARHPESALLQVIASRALLQLGRLDEAGRAADGAIERAPQLADGHYQRAVVALARRDAAAAIADLERAAALDPRHLEARKALAMLRFAQGDAAAARRLLEEVLRIDPDDADARADLAELAAGAPR